MGKEQGEEGKGNNVLLAQGEDLNWLRLETEKQSRDFCSTYDKIKKKKVQELKRTEENGGGNLPGGRKMSDDGSRKCLERAGAG